MWGAFVRWGNRRFNAVGQWLLDRDWLQVPLEPADILERARQRTGQPDSAEFPYPEALDVACRSLDRDANLSLTGRVILRTHLTQAACTRLRLFELRRRHPEWFEAPLNDPLIVVGLPRSGTTYLHRLLVELDGARGLATWEIRDPIPRQGPDRRRARGAAAVRFLRTLVPEVDRKHALDPDAAEECVGLFDPSFWTPTLWRFAACHSYREWFQAQDPTEGYRTYRALLQVFQALNPDRRLVLKLPNHLGFIDTLASVIPEARLVHTHRDPVPVIGSYNSLMCSVQSMGTERPDRHRAGRAGLQMWAWHHARARAARQRLDPARIADVQYEDLRSDPIATVAQALKHLGLPFTDDERARLQRCVAERKQHAHGRHIYALADYGLTEDDVRTAFSTA